MGIKEALWATDDQAARLAEMMSDDPRLKEAPLRRDVRSLGRLLGDVLKEQAGQALFDHVERLRLLAIEHRESQAQASQPADAYRLMEQARQFVAAMSVEQAHQLTKAFATYFELTNLAETNHRKRRRRAAEILLDRPPQPGSMRGTFARMRDAGLSAEEALGILRQIKVIP